MNNADNQRLLELLADQAVGELNATQKVELQKLLDQQTQIQSEELDYAAAAATLALIDETDALPDHISRKVMDQALAHFEEPPQNVAPFKPKTATGFLSPAWLVAAAMLVIAAVGWWPQTPPAEPSTAEQLALLQQQSDVTTYSFGATEDPYAAGAAGEVIWSNARQEGYMRIRGLHANNPSVDQYQLWIFDKTRDDRYPVDGGVFDVEPGGEVIIPITARLAVSEPALFAVTVEPPGGVVVSSRERIVLAAAVN